MIAATGWTWDSPRTVAAFSIIAALVIGYALVSESWQAHKRAVGRRYS